MSISRDTFDSAKNYKQVRYHQDRDLLDSELNEQQDILHRERKKIADRLFKEGSMIHGLGVRCSIVHAAALTSPGTSPRSRRSRCCWR